VKHLFRADVDGDFLSETDVHVQCQRNGDDRGHYLESFKPIPFLEVRFYE